MSDQYKKTSDTNSIERQQRLKRWPTLREKWKNSVVVIYSAEHRAFWRANAAGYAAYEGYAGLYTFEEAWAATHHVGPEKQIFYIKLNNLNAQQDCLRLLEANT